ncbi:Hypothetical predicted protein [Cloeon dipterum]|uniref:Uncharacterized protein n=1 Tax=Cloeon dipterum TaxID=197152 RepID=A0A8S1CIR9_9INSE|nr:Hypothetical predicted protein [Cloeon dipterum]
MKIGSAAAYSLYSSERTDNDHIEELQEALRESVRITVQEEQKRHELASKVDALEKKIRSLQSAKSERCSTCRPLLSQIPALQQKLENVLRERRSHLEDLLHMKQEALEAALSEKDAHLALLEVSGVKNAFQAEQLERLKSDRARLKLRLQFETEQAARLIQQFSEEETAMSHEQLSSSPSSHLLLDMLLTEQTDGDLHDVDHMEPDSLDESSSQQESVMYEKN